jgi:hypothetical protein
MLLVNEYQTMEAPLGEMAEKSSFEELTGFSISSPNYFGTYLDLSVNSSGSSS